MIWRNEHCEWSLRDRRKAEADSAIRQMTDTERVVSHAKPKKDTKRWCKGKVGREHQYGELYPYYQGYARKWHERLCATCGKKELIAKELNANS